MGRKLLIAGNWKMHKTCKETDEFFQNFLQSYAGGDCDILICPPFTSLIVAMKYKKGNIHIGAQNLNENPFGAYTGEVSATMLVDIGVEYVIVGHSERRTLYGEANSLINKKVIAAINAGLKPILCIGETLAERESGATKSILEMQLNDCLSGLSENQYNSLTIAYEPVWAIGTGKTATPELAQETHKLIRNWIAGNLNKATADTIRILYGGSLKADNAKHILGQEDIDGGLIGGASLDPKSLNSII